MSIYTIRNEIARALCLPVYNSFANNNHLLKNEDKDNKILKTYIALHASRNETLYNIIINIMYSCTVKIDFCTPINRLNVFHIHATWSWNGWKVNLLSTTHGSVARQSWVQRCAMHAGLWLEVPQNRNCKNISTNCQMLYRN